MAHLLHGAGSQDLNSGNSGLDSAAHSLSLCLVFVNCRKGLDQPFLPKKVAIRIQEDGQ